MTFSPAQFTATIDEINRGLDDLSVKIGEVPAAANAALAHWYVPDPVKDVIRWCAERITTLATWIWDKIKETLHGAAAPVLFFSYAFDWQDVRGVATNVAGRLKPDLMPAASSWTGEAATAYRSVIKPQGDAAARLGVLADKTATALVISAGAGLAFYVAMAAILVKFIAAMITVIAAFGSVAFSWAGAVLIVEEAAVNSAAIWAAIALLTAALGVQAEGLVTLHGEAGDHSAFPNGNWPNPTTDRYDDATVTDGDADWSLNE